MTCSLIGHEMAEESPNACPSCWPTDPKMAQERPREAKMRPRGLSEPGRSPSWGQDGPKMGPRRPREPLIGPRWGQEGPTMGQDGAKKGPRLAQDGSRSPEQAQDGPKMGPRRAQDGPKMCPRWPKIGLTGLLKTEAEKGGLWVKDTLPFLKDVPSVLQVFT